MMMEAMAVRMVCDVCGWGYDEAAGDEAVGAAPGTAFSELPEGFVCPLCGVGKEHFTPEGD